MKRATIDNTVLTVDTGTTLEGRNNQVYLQGSVPAAGCKLSAISRRSSEVTFNGGYESNENLLRRNSSQRGVRENSQFSSFGSQTR